MRPEQLEPRTLLTTFTVNTLTDSVDASPGDGIAADASGNVSLRAAVQEANELAGDDIIMLPAGTFSFSLTSRNEDAGTSGDLDLTGNVTILGTGAASTIIDFDSSDRIFDVLSGATVTIRDVTLTDGNINTLTEHGAAIRNQGTLLVEDAILSSSSSSGGGGAIYNAAGATLTVRNVSLGGNSAGGPSGGGAIYNQGVATIEDAIISSNFGSVRGGAIYNAGASANLTLRNSTVSGNLTSSNRDGGGIYNTGQLLIERSTIDNNQAQNGAGLYTTVDGSLVDIVNSTFSANFASVRGGGIYIAAPDNLAIPVRLNLFQSTVTANIAGTEGGGAYNEGTFVIGGSIIVSNTTTASPSTNDVRGGASTLGYNLLGPGLVTGNGTDINTSDPMLGPLANNGGPTRTHALLSGSEAIDASSASVSQLNVTVDQRGFARPIDGDGNGNAMPDIGAFELQPYSYTAPTATDMQLRLSNTTILLIDLSDQSIINSFEYADTPSLTINGSNDADSLDVDFSGGNPIPTGGLVFNGGGQTSGGDVLSLSSGSFNAVSHSFLNSSDGSISLDTGSAQFSIDYTGLEPISDNLSAVNRTFAFSTVGPHSVTLSDDETSGDSVSRIASASSSETVDFLAPTGSLLITAGAGDDTITLAGIDSLFAASLQVQSGTGNDRVDASALSLGVTVDGQAGNDSLFGGSGSDSLQGNLGNDYIEGGAGDDSLYGSAGLDQLFGQAGNDVVRGQGSSGDTVSGGLGDDILDGGSNDKLFEAEDVDMYVTATSMSGGIGNDILIGITAVFLFGGPSNNVIDVSAFPLYTQFYGEGGNDLLIGGESISVILGGDGDDTLLGNGSYDVLRGGAGADSLDGGDGPDLLLGQGGSRDTLRGGSGDDTLDGGLGNDIVFEVALAAGGNFTIADRSLTGVGNDSLKNIERVRLDAGDGDNLIDGHSFTGDLILNGFLGNDTILGGSGNDVLYGAGGDDVLRGGTGNDRLDGNDGNDTLNGGAGNDTLDGGNGADGLSGWTGNDSLLGGAGNDTLYGGDNNDVLFGGTGNDTLQGGTGSDTVSGNDDSEADTLTGGSGAGSADAGDTVNGSGPDVIDEAFNLMPTPAWVSQI